MTAHVEVHRSSVGFDRTRRATGVRSWRRLLAWLREGQLGHGYSTSWPPTHDIRSI